MKAASVRVANVDYVVQCGVEGCPFYDAEVEVGACPMTARPHGASCRGLGDAARSVARDERHALRTMNAVSLHQTNRLFPDHHDIPMKMHPLTCGRDSSHAPLFPFWNAELGVVQLLCRDCDYTQDNAGPCG